MPIIANGTVYLQDLGSNVTAVDLATGATKWTHAYDEPVIGPNGAEPAGRDALRRDRLVRVRARTRRTGPSCGGRSRSPGAPLTGAPAVHGGQVYAGTITRAGGGLVFALDQQTGATQWTFNTLKDPSVIPPQNPAAGIWNTPLVDPKGDVYFGTGNAYTTTRFLLENPTPLLYTNSMLKIVSKSGALRSGTSRPSRTTSTTGTSSCRRCGSRTRSGRWSCHGREDGLRLRPRPGSTGKLIWKIPVGDHNGHDNDSRKALATRAA